MHQNRKICIQIELVYNVISWFTRLHAVPKPTFEGSLRYCIYKEIPLDNPPPLHFYLEGEIDKFRFRPFSQCNRLKYTIKLL